jgi:virginiamycin B lyase
MSCAQIAHDAFGMLSRAAKPNARMRRILSLLGLTPVAFACLPMLLPNGARAQGQLVPLPHELIEEFALPFSGESLAAGPEGSIWGAGPNEIERMSPSGLLTGRYQLSALGESPDEPASSSYPRELTLASDGKLWFIEHSNVEGQPLIGSITPAGEVRETPIPWGEGSLNGITAGPSGAIWFTGTLFSTNIQQGEAFVGSISASEATIRKISIPPGEHPAGIPFWDAPASIVEGSDGNLWFADESGGSEGRPYIGRLTPDGLLSRFTLPNLHPPSEQLYSVGGLVLDAQGNVWFEVDSEEIDQITPAGVITAHHLPTGYALTSEPLVLGPEGDLWFVCNSEDVGRIAPNGSIRLFSGLTPTEAIVASLTRGAEGDLWFYTHAGMVRLRPPLAPVPTSPPVLSGDPSPGNSLSVSEGSWSTEPVTLEYNWELCNQQGESCEPLPGETAAATAVTAGEVGHTLRGVVTATSAGGSTSATSAAGLVANAPSSGRALYLAPSTPSALAGAPPEVGAAMTWRFRWLPTYTQVTSLIVTGLVPGEEVETRCAGAGCPFRRKAQKVFATTSHTKGTEFPKTHATHVATQESHGGHCKVRCAAAGRGDAGEVVLADILRGAHLRSGTKMSVAITQPGWIGKLFSFTMRADRTPRVQITCLAEGSHNRAAEC